MIRDGLPPTGAGWAGQPGVQGCAAKPKAVGRGGASGHLVPEDSVFALLATHRPVPRLLALARRSATVGCAVVGHAIGRTSLPRRRS
jgi:hypothetical protein